jgi:hypothetical protein
VPAIAAALETHGPGAIAVADRFLEGTFWDATWSRVNRLLSDVLPIHLAERAPARSRMGISAAAAPATT